jgi:hypothetical protein
MPLRSTQPLTEMNTRNLPRAKGWPVRRADNLTAISEPIVYKMWEFRRLTMLRTSKASYRVSFTYLIGPNHFCLELPMIYLCTCTIRRSHGVVCKEFYTHISEPG